VLPTERLGDNAVPVVGYCTASEQAERVRGGVPERLMMPAAYADTHRVDPATGNPLRIRRRIILFGRP
jgi:hypothetical protein